MYDSNLNIWVLAWGLAKTSNLEMVCDYLLTCDDWQLTKSIIVLVYLKSNLQINLILKYFGDLLILFVTRTKKLLLN